MVGSGRGALFPMDPHFCSADRWRRQNELLQILISEHLGCSVVGSWNNFGWLLRSNLAMG
jgi:hypothetical protein